MSKTSRDIVRVPVTGEVAELATAAKYLQQCRERGVTVAIERDDDGATALAFSSLPESFTPDQAQQLIEMITPVADHPAALVAASNHSPEDSPP